MRDEILVTGGCGYVGSLLVKKLIKDYSVTVIDTQWFEIFLMIISILIYLRVI